MLHKSKGEIQWLEFELLQPFENIVHGTFLRQGGISKFPFNSLNLGEDVGDHPDHAKHHRSLVQRALAVPQLVYARQYHSIAISEILPARRHKVSYGDGLLTQAPGVGLLIKHADCQAALFYDPIHYAIANIHCGWKGHKQNIYAHTIEQMQQHYGSQPEQLIVCISPSLGPTAAQFMHYHEEFPPEFWSFQVTDTYFDLWQLSRYQLLQAGILVQNIEIAQMCTYSNSNDFFSYRREKTTGRNGTVVALID